MSAEERKEFVITAKDLQKFEHLRGLIRAGEYVPYRDAVVRYRAELSVLKRTNESDLWKELGKQVFEPAYNKFILKPQGIKAELRRGFSEDFIYNNEKHDVKEESAPFFKYNWVFPRSFDRDDNYKYPPDVWFDFYHIRMPGSQHLVDGKLKTYGGQAVDVVCRCTAGELKNIIKARQPILEPYKSREKEAPQSGNESQRYVLDIRWIPMWLRFNGVKFVPSAWTTSEMGCTELD